MLGSVDLRDWVRAVDQEETKGGEIPPFVTSSKQIIDAEVASKNCIDKYKQMLFEDIVRAISENE